MIHHNVSYQSKGIYHYSNGIRVPTPYGVSRACRALSQQALIRKDSQILAFLRGTLGLTVKQVIVVTDLLRLWCYYGTVYPKQATMTERPQGSKATFWRTIALLKEKQLVAVVNRYVRREEAQISNLYILDKLVLAIAKYLSEKGHKFAQQWLKPLFQMDWQDFWASYYDGQVTGAPLPTMLDTP